MKTYALKKIALAIILLLICAPAYAYVDGRNSEAISGLMSKINEFRQDAYANAMAFASAEGMDQGKLPEWMDELKEQSLKPLAVNDMNASCATLLAEEMFKANSIEIVPANEERLISMLGDAGYSAMRAGASSGMYVFRNYMPPSAVVDALFRNMLIRDMAKPDRSSGVIFNGSVSDVGLSFIPGLVNVGGRNYNAYLSVCVASDIYRLSDHDRIQVAEALTVLMNQARIYPLSSALNAGVDSEKVMPMIPAFNFITRPAIIVKIDEPVSNNMVEPSVSGPENKLAPIAEIRFEYSSDSAKNAADLASALFKNLLDAETGLAPEERIIYNATYHPLTRVISSVSINIDTLYKGSLFFGYAAKVTLWPVAYDNSSFVNGAVFMDNDSDGMYDPDESVPANMILRYGNGKELAYLTGDSGLFGITASEIPDLLTISNRLKIMQMTRQELSENGNKFLLVNMASAVEEGFPN